MMNRSPLSVCLQFAKSAFTACRQAAATTAEAPAAAGLEALETRTLMSVTMGADGWTNIGASPDTRMVFVSSSTGNDANTGLAPDQAVKSLAKGESLLRNGSPDWLLLKRGDTWTGQTLGRWDKSGRSAAEPMLVSSYGATAAARPLIETGAGDGVTSGGTAVSHVAFVGLQFYADARDPSSPTFNSGAAHTDAAGMRWLAAGGDILVEDSSFRSFGDNVIFQGFDGPQTNMKLRRSEILDSYNADGNHSQGIYVDNVSAFLAEGNIFDHNGSNDRVAGAEPTVFNHDLYIQTTVTGMTIKDNVISRGAATGAQARPGGTVTGNLFLRNPTAVFMMDLPGVGPGTLCNNTILEGTDIAPGVARGWGINIANVGAAGMTVSNNVVAHTATGSGSPAIDIDGSNGDGVTNAKVTGNVICDWPGGISAHGNVTNTTTTGNNTAPAGPAMNRSVESYQGTLGGAATFDAFIAAARAQSKANWVPQYQPAAVGQYIRSGLVGG